MKKFISLLITVSFMLAALACAVQAGSLVMGRVENVVGNFSIGCDGSTIKVTLNIFAPWEFVETHLYVDPVIPKQSAPGQFPFMHDTFADTSTDYFGSADGLPSGTGTFPHYFAMQAKVRQIVGYLDQDGNLIVDEYDSPILDPGEFPTEVTSSTEVYEYESVWGRATGTGIANTGIPRKGKGKSGTDATNWATYFVYNPTC